MPHQLTRTSAVRGPLLPGWHTLRHYDRSWLRGDLVGGVTVAAYLVPQVMAYAAVAGLPAVTGLWAALAPLAVYALLGSSRQLSVGPESTTALMTAAAVGAMTLGDPERYAEAAAALAIVVGAVCLAGRVLRIGFVADLLSRPVLIGYLAGIAALMIVGQLGRLTGIEVEGDGPLEETAYALGHLGEAHLPTVVVAGAVTAGLLLAQRWRPHWPNPLLGMLLAAAAVQLLGLEADGVGTVGAIPAGLPVPGLPDVSWEVVAELALPAVGVAVVGYTDNMLDARAFAARHRDHVDPDQELLALGAINIGSGLFQGFPVSSSGSRTVIGDALGVRSQLHSLVALATVLVGILALRPVLGSFPQAALGGVVTYAAIGLVDTAEIRRIARFRRSELVLVAATTVSVLLLGVLAGIAAAVGLSILDLLRRVARGHDGILGFVPGLAGMHDVDDHPTAGTVDGLVVYRYDSPLFFANADDFRQRARQAVLDADPAAEWLLLNMEANVEVDLTALDALEELRADLEHRGVVLALARVKQDLREDLDRSGLTERIGAGRLYATLPTAVAAYAAWYAARHGREPGGLPG
ncbi:SulP family inorganic anion transporter [Nocardioides ferulae]|uniref:SulP family inorganic anion transporter n=1 Tax=Nocardioides ferulae TaxID=2340821 RepID=UPI001F0C6A48|nr:sulfate permease [Nocardioides ferulae]